MENKVYIAGTGMTRFAKWPDRGLKSLAAEAVTQAFEDSGLSPKDLDAAYAATAAAPVITGQQMIAGQVVLRPLGIGKIPIMNVENACATSAAAVQQAMRFIALGEYDCVLVVGMEKLVHEDKAKTFSTFAGAIDVEAAKEVMTQLSQGADERTKDSLGGDKRSLFMDVYAASARGYMAKYGATARHFAMVSAKNSYHGSLNPRAQFREVLTEDEVLAAPPIANPLTRPMCAPIGDGAAAAILVSEKKAREMGLRNAVRIRACVLASGWEGSGANDISVVEHASQKAYALAGLGPEDLDVVEVHDASAPAEIVCTEQIGLAKRGEGFRLLEDGATRLGGRLPVNPSGGLLRKGHPVGATGCGQIFELCEHLRGRAGERQVEGARIALAENAGGFLGTDSAVANITILEGNAL
ncbi:MAG: thiolase family protein [Alphaproteobacteria bacterium]|nr:thiolase family protein [Alphaproteobacteria bacterium]